MCVSPGTSISLKVSIKDPKCKTFSESMNHFLYPDEKRLDNLGQNLRAIINNKYKIVYKASSKKNQEGDYKKCDNFNLKTYFRIL